MEESPQNSSPGPNAPGENPSLSPKASGLSRWPWLAGGLAVIIVAALIVTHLAGPRGETTPRTLITPVGSMTPPGGQGVCSPSTPIITQAVSLRDLAMVSPTEGWAIGVLDHADNEVNAGVILHDINGKWQQIGGDYPNVSFDSISMTSPTNGWIGGVDTSLASLGNSETHPTRLLFHYNGQSWQPVQLSSTVFGDTYGGEAGNTIVRMYSATDGWLMVRDTLFLNNYILLHYNGTDWQPVQSPFDSTINKSSMFYDMDVTGPNDVWLAGTLQDDTSFDGQHAILAHYHNGQWNTIANPPAGNDESIAMATTTQGWAIVNNLVFKLNGQQVTPDALPNGLVGSSESIGSYESVDNAKVAPDGSLWMAGDGPSGQISSFLLHQKSNGVWERIALPYAEYLDDLDIVASDDIWAIGAIYHQNGCPPAHFTSIDQGTILHWHAGQWSQVIEPAS